MGEAPETKVGRFERERRMMRGGKEGEKKEKKVGNRKSVRVRKSMLNCYTKVWKRKDKTSEEKQKDGCR